MSTTIKMSEAELQSAVIECARTFGWLVHHVRPARRKDGSWSTPLQGDKGFFDLALARYPARGKRQLILAELKREGAKLTPEQEAWLRAIPLNVQCYVWFPSDWVSGKIEARLR